MATGRKIKNPDNITMFNCQKCHKPLTNWEYFLGFQDSGDTKNVICSSCTSHKKRGDDTLAVAEMAKKQKVINANTEKELQKIINIMPDIIPLQNGDFEYLEQLFKFEVYQVKGFNYPRITVTDAAAVVVYKSGGKEDKSGREILHYLITNKIIKSNVA